MCELDSLFSKNGMKEVAVPLGTTKSPGVTGPGLSRAGKAMLVNSSD
jgi:hypothetical protein